MKFIYMSDTHLGAKPMGYQQQKGYPENLDILLDRLSQWIEERGDIDFILHGGDMVDSALRENIKGAEKLFKLPVPVYLCLGNHDVTDVHALDLWLEHGKGFFLNSSPDYTISKDGVFLHVMPNQWVDTPYFWQQRQDPHFLPEQLEKLDQSIVENPDAIHIISIHSPVLGIPAEQTGFEQPYHHPGENFSEGIFSLLRKYPSIKAVLAGHNHINSYIKKGGAHLVTASAFSEAPFECKMIEISSEKMEMSTLSFISTVDFKAEYDYDKTYVQGRKKDRAFSEEWI